MSDTGVLAPYACNPAHTRGRRYRAAPTRSAFELDRDRIVDCSAFRRLVYKTQVFLNHEGDLFRTRLTHSIEVAHVARAMARSLHLNEDLVEAIALAHDLGHTPFGHAGQDALNGCMSEHGGFEHNLQSLRIVDQLEERYPDFNGLNLCFETREGILKHCSRSNAHALELGEPPYPDGQGGVGARFIDGKQPSLEAQLCNLADEMTYNAHDIDDGVRSGLLSLEQLQAVSLYRQHHAESLRAQPQLATPHQARRLMYETLRRMLAAQMQNAVEVTQRAIDAAQVDSVAAVRNAAPLVQFDPAMRQQSLELKSFLLHNLYRHPRVVSTMDLAQHIIRALFAAYMQSAHGWNSGPVSGEPMERRVADYIAGMTDRFALREHERLTGARVLQ